MIFQHFSLFIFKIPFYYPIFLPYFQVNLLQSRSGISEFKEIDIRQYGKPVFLPASRKKIYDGNEYFIIFQPSKNHTKAAMQNYFKIPGISTSTCDNSYLRILNVGIQFPNKFVAYIADRELTEKELRCLLQYLSDILKNQALITSEVQKNPTLIKLDFF